MNVYDLDDNMYAWNLVGHKPNLNIKKSSLHLRARNIIISTYPTLQILEEVPIKTHKSDTLYLDFYIPLKRMCIETHGEQHYKFVAHYHGNTLGFLRHRKRDFEKQEWCDKNGIIYIEFPFDESDEQWQKRLEQQENN